MVDHQRLRRADRHTWQPPVLGEHQVLRHPVIRPARLLRPLLGGRLRDHGLVQDARDVDRLGGHRGDPQPGDGPGEQILGHRQLRPHPPAGDRLHREHIQVLSVKDGILARPPSAQPPVGSLRLVRDRPAALRAPGHRVGAPGQLGQPPVCRRRRRPRDHPFAVDLVQPCIHHPHHGIARRGGATDQIRQHQPHRFIPAVIDSAASAPHRPVVDQASLTSLAVGSRPAPDSPFADSQLPRLGPAAGAQRLALPIFWAWLPRRCAVWVT